jgi:asparagine synthase (glutamine-hydrolysing)
VALCLLNCWAVGGIIGKLSFDSGETLARPVLDRMVDACAAPGETGRGVFAAPGIALGWCARDAAPAAPGTNPRRTLHAIADANLTNASQLRNALRRRRHAFLGTSDNELVAHAYEEWGRRCFEKFRGPFACAIWDERRRRLVVARDHMGIRPLYFAVLHGHGVVFASEIRALLQDPGVGREWCPAAIDAYLALGYVPAPLSAFRRISKLEPAHVLVVEGRRLQVSRYWDLPSPSTASEERDAVAALDEALRATVARNLEAGAAILYSGGTASTALLSVAPRKQGTPVTVHVNQDPSELTRSDRAAARLERTRELEFATPAVPALINELAAHCGEPVADPTALTQLMVCTAARRHASVVLGGHGAAVLWGGRARQRVERTDDGLWNGHHRRAIYTRDFAWSVREANPYQRHLELFAARDAGDAADRAFYVDARMFLPDNVIAPAVRAAIAAGVALRFSFLDVPLVEQAARLPVSTKVHGHTGMHILRGVIARRLQAALLPPLHPPAGHRWLKPALAAMVPAVLLRPRFDGRGIVSRPAIAHLWDDHLAGTHDHSHRLWSLLMLEFWFRQFVDGDAAIEEPYEYAAVVKAA